MSYEPLFRTIPEPRGCGDRTPGGLYIESGLGPGGVPLEHFLVDPPLPVPDGLDLVNKPQIVEDTETGSVTGVPCASNCCARRWSEPKRDLHVMT